MQNLWQFLQDNKNYCVCFVNRNDSHTSGKLNLENHITVYGSLKDRVFIYNSYDTKSLEKQETAERFIVKVCTTMQDKKYFNTIISFDPEINIKSIKEELTKLNLVSDKVLFENVSQNLFNQISSNKNLCNGLTKLLYKKHCELDKLQHENAITNIKNLYQQNLQMAERDYSCDFPLLSEQIYKLSNVTGNNKSVLFIINDSLMFKGIEKAAREIIFSIGPKIIPLVYAFFQHEKEFITLKNDQMTKEYTAFWDKIFKSMSLTQSTIGKTQLDEFWQALSKLDKKGKLSLYQVVSFLIKNDKYYILLTSSAGWYSISNDNIEKSDQYYDLTKRINVVSFEEQKTQALTNFISKINPLHNTNAKVVEAVILKIQCLLCELQKIDRIYILDPKINKKNLVTGLAKDLLKNIHIEEHYPGIKHLNNVPGVSSHSITLIKLLIEIDSKCNL